MKKLALSDEILLKIDKPARYLGNEINAVIKDPEQVDIRFCMCFPDVYEHTITTFLLLHDFYLKTGFQCPAF